MLGRNIQEMLLFANKRPHKSNLVMVVYQASQPGSEEQACGGSKLLGRRAGPSERHSEEAPPRSCLCFEKASSILHF